MAIYSAVPPPPEQASTTASASHPPAHHHQLSSASTASVDIEAWTVSALQSLSISPVAVGTGNVLSIPLDDPARQAAAATRMKLRNVTIDVDQVGAAVTPPRRPPSRRDSMRRREALLKGKEGSRQRRRWENDSGGGGGEPSRRAGDYITPPPFAAPTTADPYHTDRLLHLPIVEPPTPADWDIRPTHPVHHIPYQLAQFWDQKGAVRERAEQRQAAAAAAAAVASPSSGKVPRDLHAKAKRTPAVKSWLRVLEEPVRQFLVDRGAVAAEEEISSSDGSSSDDDEIVFVGRNGSMTDARGWKRARREGRGREPQQGLVLDALGDDESASFKRWLTHSISDYYGLDSKSVSIGTPAKKVVYIGIKQVPLPRRELPRPLWEMF